MSAEVGLPFSFLFDFFIIIIFNFYLFIDLFICVAVRVAESMQQEVTAKRGELDALQNKLVVKRPTWAGPIAYLFHLFLAPVSRICVLWSKLCFV